MDPGSLAATDPFADWLGAARDGSRDDLGHALEACRGYLLMMADAELGSTLRPKAGASDVVQDSLLEAQEGFGRFRGRTREEFLAWVAQILRRNLADVARRYREADRRAVGREEPLTPRSDPEPASAAGPAARAAAAEEADRLRAAIGRLPDEPRNVLAWRHQDGLGWEEIGRRLGKTPEAARKVWFRAVERLRAELTAGHDHTG